MSQTFAIFVKKQSKALLWALTASFCPALLQSATTLYLRSSIQPMSVAGDRQAAFKLQSSAGGSLSSFVKAVPSNGGLNPNGLAARFTESSGGPNVSWTSDPLMGFTLSGDVTFNLWALESDPAANVAITASLVRLDGN